MRAVIRRELRRPNRSWRVDETYVKVAGTWAYLYRAVDSNGETIEFMLSPNRDLVEAKMFPRLALFGDGPALRVINVDGHPAYPLPSPNSPTPASLTSTVVVEGHPI